MKTIARANRVYDDEKENGLIVDYGNVYAQLEKAYSVYGEGTEGGTKKPGEEDTKKPIELILELEEELKEAIGSAEVYLTELGFSLSELINAEIKPMHKLGKIKSAVDCVSLNETSRTKFEIMARDVFRKYHALYPEEQVKAYLKKFNALEAIYNQLNQQVKSADVTSIIMELQALVNESIFITPSKVEDITVDLGNLDFDKLKAAFQKVARKNTMVFNLQKAVEQKLEQMLKENPLRFDFYERYQVIIEEYNKGKSLEDTLNAFDKLSKFIKDLNFEEARAVRENLNDETLAIFDLLREGKNLESEEIKEVKKVAVATLDLLKEQKLKVDRWRDSRQISAQVKTMIFDSLQWLPTAVYTDDDVNDKTNSIYQHIYTNYPGGGTSVYVSGN